MVASETEPLPVAREIRVDMGPKQIRLMTMAMARIAAIQDSLRISFFRGFLSFITATVTMMARARMMPMAMK